MIKLEIMKWSFWMMAMAVAAVLIGLWDVLNVHIVRSHWRKGNVLGVVLENSFVIAFEMIVPNLFPRRSVWLLSKLLVIFLLLFWKWNFLSLSAIVFVFVFTFENNQNENIQFRTRMHLIILILFLSLMKNLLFLYLFSFFFFK